MKNWFKVIIDSVAGKKPGEIVKGTDIYNWGLVGKFNNCLVCRGSAPSESDYKYLAETLGITSILDLRDKPKDFAPLKAKEFGINYRNFRFKDNKYPDVDWVKQVIRLIENTEGHLFIHCKGGRHRTGMIVAALRQKQGWTFENALKEMVQHDFYTAFGHAPILEFVVDCFDVQRSNFRTSSHSS